MDTNILHLIRGRRLRRSVQCFLFPLLLLTASGSWAAAPASVNHGDVAWMLTATLLVLMMSIPGVALFYGGLVRSKNTLSVLMQVLTVFALVLLLWALFGYSLVFDAGGGLIGGWGKAFMHGITAQSLIGAEQPIPEYLYFAFQATFAGIACALVVGALAERMKFGAVLLFTVLWFVFAYLPVAHMVWAPHGWLRQLGALDFAGGTVVHINAGVAGLIGAALLGPRIDVGRVALRPHNLPLSVIGAALLWVGWFGFNAGSALQADSVAVVAFVDTLLAPAGGILAWAAAEALMGHKPSVLGALSGAIAGLVGITPACGNAGPMAAIVIGALTSLACLWGVNGLKNWLAVDDALDTFGIHAVGGIVGALLTGIFSASVLGGHGAPYGILHQFGVQTLAVLMTIGWSATVALLSGVAVKYVYGLRVSIEDEHEGLDITAHGESAYEK